MRFYLAAPMMDDHDNLSVRTAYTAASTTTEDTLDLEVWCLGDLNEEKIMLPKEEADELALYVRGMSPHDNRDDNINNDASKLTEKTHVP